MKDAVSGSGVGNWNCASTGGVSTNNGASSSSSSSSSSTSAVAGVGRTAVPMGVAKATSLRAFSFLSFGCW